MFNLISKIGASWFSRISDFMLGLFAAIPQLIYFLYASVACLLDALQYVLRKLAGLDVYYIDGTPRTGDIVLSFIKGVVGIDKSPTYSSLTTVFWSLVAFGIILLVLTTIFQLIKAHYNYDAKKSHPFTIIGQSLKSLALMAIVPLTAIFGLYISQILLSTLDSITSYSSASEGVFTITDDQGNVVSSISDSFEGGYTYVIDGSDLEYEEDEEGNKTNKVVKKSDTPVYASYDIFSSVMYTNSTTFSGVLFKTAAYNCNRVRMGQYTPTNQKTGAKWDNFGVFYSTANGDELKSIVAEQIDYAFANCLTLKADLQRDNRLLQQAQGKNWDYVSGSQEDASIATAYFFGYGALNLIGLHDVKCFSKFNVGLVYYYYNLWGFNFFIGFAGVIAFVVVLGNITFGLITRLIQLLALFFVFPPLIGIAPLDEGNAFKQWRKQFLADVLMAYGAIIGMNLFFLILPFLNTISFFNIAILDAIMNILIMLAGLTMVGNLIKLLSGFIGGSDANKTGEDTRKAAGELGGKTLAATAKAGSLGIKVGKGATNILGGVARGAGSLIARGGRRMVSSATETHYRNKAERQLTKEGKIHAGMSMDEVNKRISAKMDELKTQDVQKKVMKAQKHAASREKFKNSSFAKGVVKYGGKVGRGVVGTVMGALGADVKKKDDGTIDVKGTIKGFGKATLNLAETTIKLGGDLLRINAVGKKANESGYMDPVKTFVKDAMGNKMVKGSASKALTTKKEKEEKELAALSAQQRSAAESAENAEKQSLALEKILKEIQKKS